MMEKFFALLKLGIKYLYRYRRRYGFLLAALIFGFAVVTFITSMKDGMYAGVYYNAQSHYAGDIIVLGDRTSTIEDSNRIHSDQVSLILNGVQAAGIRPAHTVLRTRVFDGSIIHYYGAAVPLKYLMGCDWETEEHLFSKMTFDERLDSFYGDDGVIISVPVAQMLNIRAGDSIILEVETHTGQRNTGSFIVKGIVSDASIFGYYKAYISRLTLNRLILYDDDDCSMVGLFLANSSHARRKSEVLQGVLAGQMEMRPLVFNREEYDRARRQSYDRVGFFLITLPVFLSEVADLLNAMNVVTYFVYGMMLIIILVSAAVTYRLILHERTREMGIMRVIGFYGRDLHLVLWTEIIAVGLISLTLGFLLAGILGWLVSLLSFSWFPSFEIFMTNGRLMAMYRPATMLFNVLSIFLLLFAMALFPSFRASRKNLPGLLSGEPL